MAKKRKTKRRIKGAKVSRPKKKYYAAIIDFEKGYGDGARYLEALRRKGFIAKYEHCPYVTSGTIGLSFDNKTELKNAYKAIRSYTGERISIQAMADEVMENIRTGNAIV